MVFLNFEEQLGLTEEFKFKLSSSSFIIFTLFTEQIQLKEEEWEHLSHSHTDRSKGIKLSKKNIHLTSDHTVVKRKILESLIISEVLQLSLNVENDLRFSKR